MNFRLPACALLIVLLSACATQPGISSQAAPEVPAPLPPPVRVAPTCQDCGRVERMETRQVPLQQRTNAHNGAVLGGIVGGVITGPAKPPVGPAPAATQRVTQIAVRMDDGRRLVLRQNVISPDLRIGSRVRVTGGRVVLLR